MRPFRSLLCALLLSQFMGGCTLIVAEQGGFFDGFAIDPGRDFFDGGLQCESSDCFPFVNDANDADPGQSTRVYEDSNGQHVCETPLGKPIATLNRWDFAGGDSCGVCHCVGIDQVDCTGPACPPAAPPDQDAGAGLNCDPWSVTCAQSPQPCPRDQVNQVVDGCWGSCVAFAQCRALPCSTEYAGTCPAGSACGVSGGFEVCQDTSVSDAGSQSDAR